MTVTPSLLQPLSRQTEVQLAVAIRGCMPGTLKIGIRTTGRGYRGMVTVSYSQAPSLPSYPERKPMRRWFKLSGVWLGERDDAKREERIASILREAQAVVDAKRSTMMGYELRPEEKKA